MGQIGNNSFELAKRSNMESIGNKEPKAVNEIEQTKERGFIAPKTAVRCMTTAVKVGVVVASML